MQTDKQIHRQADRQVVKPADRKADRQAASANRQTDRETDTYGSAVLATGSAFYKSYSFLLLLQADRQADSRPTKDSRQTYGQAGRQTYTQKDMQADRQTHRRTSRQTDSPWLSGDGGPAGKGGPLSVSLVTARRQLLRVGATKFHVGRRHDANALSFLSRHRPVPRASSALVSAFLCHRFASRRGSVPHRTAPTQVQKPVRPFLSLGDFRTRNFFAGRIQTRLERSKGSNSSSSFEQHVTAGRGAFAHALGVPPCPSRLGLSVHRVLPPACMGAYGVTGRVFATTGLDDGVNSRQLRPAEGRRRLRELSAVRARVAEGARPVHPGAGVEVRCKACCGRRCRSSF